MLRLTDLIPIDHDQAALPAAIVVRLGIAASEPIGFSAAKRSNEAQAKCHTDSDEIKRGGVDAGGCAWCVPTVTSSHRRENES